MPTKAKALGHNQNKLTVAMGIEQIDFDKIWNDEDQDFYDPYYEEEDTNIEDVYCCYDPRYNGPKGVCHCAEYDKQMRYEQRLDVRMKRWFRRNVYWPIKRRLERLFTWTKKKVVVEILDDLDIDDLPF